MFFVFRKANGADIAAQLIVAIVSAVSNPVSMKWAMMVRNSVRAAIAMGKIGSAARVASWPWVQFMNMRLIRMLLGKAIRIPPVLDPSFSAA